jgi:glycosyltransferase involved in cell wall biosynthesis
MPVRVSVIVPCFNYSRYLPDCVGSLLRQSLRDWECIVVDDGSTDATPEVCAQLASADQRIKYLWQENRGLSAARNAGIRASIGDLLQFLDSDDLLEPEKLRTQVDWLDRNPQVDVVVGQAAFFKDGDAQRVKPWALDPALSDEPLAALVAKNSFVVNAVLIRRRVVDAIGLFDETLRAHEDWDYWLRCALAGRKFAVQSAEDARALVRQHVVSMSASRERMLKTSILVRERLSPLLPAPLQLENARQLSDTKCILGRELVRFGRVAEGWPFLRDGFKLSSNKPRTLSWLLMSSLPGASRLARFARELRG